MGTFLWIKCQTPGYVYWEPAELPQDSDNPAGNSGLMTIFGLYSLMYQGIKSILGMGSFSILIIENIKIVDQSYSIAKFRRLFN